MVETKPDNQNLEKLESMETDSQYLFKNIKNQVIDRLLDDIDISKISKYPDLNEFVSKYAESPEKLEKDIDDLSGSSKLLNSENESILETIKEKVKKPLAIVCLLGVLMTGSGAIEDQNRDSKLTQLANNLGINNVVHAEEEAPDWGAMNETLEEENEKLKEENDKQEERIKEKQQRLEMLRKINEQLDEDMNYWAEKEEDWAEKEEDWAEKEEDWAEKYQERKKNLKEDIRKIIELSWKILEWDVEETTLKELKKEEYNLLDQIERHNLGEDLKKEVEKSIEQIENRL